MVSVGVLCAYVFLVIIVWFYFVVVFLTSFYLLTTLSWLNTLQILAITYVILLFATLLLTGYYACKQISKDKKISKKQKINEAKTLGLILLWATYFTNLGIQIPVLNGDEGDQYDIDLTLLCHQKGWQAVWERHGVGAPLVSWLSTPTLVAIKGTNVVNCETYCKKRPCH